MRPVRECFGEFLCFCLYLKGFASAIGVPGLIGAAYGAFEHLHSDGFGVVGLHH